MRSGFQPFNICAQIYVGRLCWVHSLPDRNLGHCRDLITTSILIIHCRLDDLTYNLYSSPQLNSLHISSSGSNQGQSKIRTQISPTVESNFSSNTQSIIATLCNKVGEVVTTSHHGREPGRLHTWQGMTVVITSWYFWLRNCVTHVIFSSCGESMGYKGATTYVKTTYTI